jgi:hypothetical protein
LKRVAEGIPGGALAAWVALDVPADAGTLPLPNADGVAAVIRDGVQNARAVDCAAELTACSTATFAGGVAEEGPGDVVAEASPANAIVAPTAARASPVLTTRTPVRPASTPTTSLPWSRYPIMAEKPALWRHFAHAPEVRNGGTIALRVTRAR